MAGKSVPVSLQGRAQQYEAVGRVGRATVGWKQQRIVPKLLQAGGRGWIVRGVEGFVVVAVIAHSGPMAGKLTRGDRAEHVGKVRNVRAHRRVERQRPAFDQSGHGGRGQQLGNALQPELVMGACRDTALAVGEAHPFDHTIRPPTAAAIASPGISRSAIIARRWERARSAAPVKDESRMPGQFVTGLIAGTAGCSSIRTSVRHPRSPRPVAKWKAMPSSPRVRSPLE